MLTSDSVYLGIDIGGTSIKTGVFDAGCRLLEKGEIPTDRSSDGAHIMQDIAGFVDEVRKRASVLGIGLGVPGSVADDGTVNKCVNLGWGVCNPAEMLKKLVNAADVAGGKANVDKALIADGGADTRNIPVIAGNDANMAALGEYSVLGGRYSSILFITLGTGVGGGVVLDGKVLNGAHGAAAEIGHLPVVWDETEKCTCGKVGCLEQVASATGVVRVAKRFKEDFAGTALDLSGELTAKTVFDLARQGDAAAVKTVDYVTDYLGRGLACAAGMVDPECIIIGGGMSAAGDFLFDRIRDSFMRHVFHPNRTTPVLAAMLGNDAGIYGAAYNVIHNANA